MPEKPIETALRIKEKFEFYMLGLVFTLLALSVQTASFGNHPVADLVELLGWFFLLCSGLFGAWRLEWFAPNYEFLHKLEGYEAVVFQLEQAALTGQTAITAQDTAEELDIQDVISNRRQAVGLLESKIEEVDKKIEFRYMVHRWTFLAGVLALCIARAAPAYPSIVSIWKSAIR